ncbi:MAG: hypothetical protein C5B51_19210 [Terriglobia bacterium]|nr:MAG: hypothetical protein C5B51_19210 [Terriglobia bacterium]
MILEEDLGLVMWLGSILTESGYQAIPATTADEALRIVAEFGLKRVDLLIVNPELPDAFDLVRKLRDRQGILRILHIEESMRDPADPEKLKSDWIDRLRLALDTLSTLGPGSQ